MSGFGKNLLVCLLVISILLTHLVENLNFSARFDVDVDEI